MDLQIVPAHLQAPGATFVTLHTRSGASGVALALLQARQPLIEDVRNNALAAAFEDPRFPAVTESECPVSTLKFQFSRLPNLWLTKTLKISDEVAPAY